MGPPAGGDEFPELSWLTRKRPQQARQRDVALGCHRHMYSWWQAMRCAVCNHSECTKGKPVARRDLGGDMGFEIHAERSGGGPQLCLLFRQPDDAIAARKRAFDRGEAFAHECPPACVADKTRACTNDGRGKDDVAWSKLRIKSTT